MDINSQEIEPQRLGKHADAPMHIRTFDGDRRSLNSLFMLADDSKRQISEYIDHGEIVVATEGEAIIGHLQIAEADEPGALEIKSMAVHEAHQRKGLGRGLVKEAITRCRARGGTRLIVATATADVGNLYFYQRQGFRMFRIVRDVFSTSTGYADDAEIDGIPLRDQAVLEFDLGIGIPAATLPSLHTRC